MKFAKAHGIGNDFLLLEEAKAPKDVGPFAQRILAEEAARREAMFDQSFQAEKTRGDALSRRFEEALRQAQDEPVSKPLRDFDLD